MSTDFCSPFCMARRVDGTVTFKITLLALFLLLLLVMMANLDDDQSQSSLSQGNDPTYVASSKSQKTSEPSSTRRACRDKKSPTKAKNAVHSSPTGRRGGGNHFSWWDRVFNASAHEVPSGPNPISNR